MFIDIHTHRSETTQDIIALRSFRFGVEPIEWDHYTCAAIHPWDTNIALSDNFSAIASQLFAIAEIGLDALHPNFDKQIELFTNQLTIAKTLNKVVVIHTVKSHNETYEILRHHKGKKIIHSFIGNNIIAEKYLTAGCCLSFSPQSLRSPKTVEVLKKCNINSIFIESDTSTRPITEIYSEVAEIRSCSVAHLKESIETNFNTIFYEH